MKRCPSTEEVAKGRSTSGTRSGSSRLHVLCSLCPPARREGTGRCPREQGAEVRGLLRCVAGPGSLLPRGPVSRPTARGPPGPRARPCAGPHVRTRPRGLRRAPAWASPPLQSEPRCLLALQPPTVQISPPKKSNFGSGGGTEALRGAGARPGGAEEARGGVWV